MSFYTSNLFAFVAINTLFVFVNSRGRQPSHEDEIPKKDDTQDSQRTLRQLKTRFLPVYLLVNGADWLQVSLLAQERAPFLTACREPTSTPYIRVSLFYIPSNCWAFNEYGQAHETLLTFHRNEEASRRSRCCTVHDRLYLCRSYCVVHWHISRSIRSPLGLFDILHHLLPLMLLLTFQQPCCALYWTVPGRMQRHSDVHCI